MKRIFTCFLLTAMIFLAGSSLAQTTHPWELGFNVGAAWQQSDVKMKKLGAGLGFTLGQMYCQTETSPLDWGWRFRFLSANTYGQETKRHYGIQNNLVLNGGLDDSLNYYTSPGYVYHNYKTTLSELSLEVLIGLNRMRERTKVYPYIFGGVGITKGIAKIDQLDASNMMYDYALLDSANASSQLGSLLDNDYETFADGNTSPRWKFMPSLGVGLGYQFTKGFSMGLEHKVTWALNDVLDGQQWSNSNATTGNNDRYHYSSIWLKFSFGRKAKPTSTNTTDVTTYTNNNTVVATKPEKPAITLTAPASGSATVSQQTYTITARITNINSISDIVFTGNGAGITNFTYNAGSQIFAAPVMLINGSNNYVITATNAVGSATANASIVYNMPPPPQQLAPIVSITNPNINPFTTRDAVIGVGGTVMNITDRNQMQVSVNGAPTNSFTYSPATKAFMVNAALVLGANTFVVSATNPNGSDSKSTVVIYQQDASAFVGPPPVITITNPSANPYNTAVNVTSVTATVMNVTTSSQITVSLNGTNVPFTFNAATHQLALNAALITGANSVTISATNPNGSDTKSRTIIYTPVVSPKPIVTIINPAVNPYTTGVNVVPVNATILNVTAVGQISVSVNGSNLPTGALSFNAATASLTFNANLIAGANSVQVTATNVAGSDSKSTTIIYTQPVAAPAPVVTITNPSVNPFNTTVNAATVNATVLNVTSASQITVSLNGSPSSSFSFNAVTHQLVFNASLIAGSNTVSVTATNSSGADSKSTVIIYTAPAPMLPPVITITSPNVNPFMHNALSYTVKATVVNVTSASQIQVLLDATPTTAFTYSTTTKVLTYNATLHAGANSIKIVATNAAGSDTKSTTIKVLNTSGGTGADTPTTEPGKPVKGGPGGGLGGASGATSGAGSVGMGTSASTPSSGGPAITLVTPSGTSVTTTDAVYTVVATVDVPNQMNIVVKINGVATSTFSFNRTAKTLSIPLTLTPGNTVVTIEASGGSGTSSKTITITKP